MPVMSEFDQRQGCSDGGAVLLKAADTVWVAREFARIVRHRDESAWNG
jgi:hypothetical protein